MFATFWANFNFLLNKQANKRQTGLALGGNSGRNFSCEWLNWRPTWGQELGTAANNAQGIQIKFMSLSGGEKVVKGRRRGCVAVTL